MKIFSVFWGINNTFIYNTLNHLKFGLLNGETGIIKCLDQRYGIVAYPKN